MLINMYEWLLGSFKRIIGQSPLKQFYDPSPIVTAAKIGNTGIQRLTHPPDEKSAF